MHGWTNLKKIKTDWTCVFLKLVRLTIRLSRTCSHKRLSILILRWQPTILCSCDLILQFSPSNTLTFGDEEGLFKGDLMDFLSFVLLFVSEPLESLSLSLLSVSLSSLLLPLEDVECERWREILWNTKACFHKLFSVSLRNTSAGTTSKLPTKKTFSR